jgi:hypothetical protein
MRSKSKRSTAVIDGNQKLRRKHKISPLADSRVTARVAARLECLDDDPLEFFDFGMHCGFDLAEAELLDLLRKGEVLTAELVREVFAKERETVHSADLHSFYFMPDARTASTEGSPQRVERKLATSAGSR